MRRFLILSFLILSCGPGIAWPGERLAVLEFFGRPHGGFCQDAGPAMIALQDELQGQAVLLEYDFDAFNGTEILDRFWASGSQAGFLPLVMVGSGYRTFGGPSPDHYPVFSNLIAEELSRPPRAEVEAWWWRSGDLVRCSTNVRNVGTEPMRTNQDAAAWAIVYEESPIGVSTTWVRTASRRGFTSDLGPNEMTHVSIDSIVTAMGDWNLAKVLVLVEDRPWGTSAPFDMAQAALARPAALEVSPGGLVLTANDPSAEIVLRGPHVLQWTAETDVSWLEIEPSYGSVPDSTTVTYRPQLQPPGQDTATITFYAAGDSLSFNATVDVVAGSKVRRSGRRVTPDP